jgi:hypothetical protein
VPKKKPLALHPFIFAIFPVLSLLAYNIEETRLATALRPLLLSLAGAVLVFGILRLVTRDNQRAALITILLLALFFSYGHFYNTLESGSILGGMLGRHRILAPVWVILASIIVGMGLRSRADLSSITTTFNLVTFVMLLLPVLQISSYQLRAYQAASAPQVAALVQSLHLPSGQSAPDIYYIILDGYSRDDMLKKYYQLDNQPFLNDLEALGFFVARCSRSNYAQTQLSLASSLNFNYLDELGTRYTPDNTSRVGLEELIRHSALRRSLEGLGYKIVAFDTGYDATRLRDADLYLSPSVVADIDDFENLYVRTTAARLFSEGVTLLNLAPDWEKRDEAYRQRILFSLDELENLPSVPGPKFVFAHIVAPHWPHVFGPNGEPVHERPDSQAGYRNQVIFINKRILPILENLIRNSPTPPVIIIQGDHGAIIEDPVRRMSILNAIYIPGGSPDLYESISPVNSFRILLNQLFGGDFPVLPDTSYYSRYDEPYRYQEIPNTRPGCQD